MMGAWAGLSAAKEWFSQLWVDMCRSGRRTTGGFLCQIWSAETTYFTRLKWRIELTHKTAGEKVPCPTSPCGIKRKLL